MSMTAGKLERAKMMREELLQVMDKYPEDIAVATLGAAYFSMLYEILNEDGEMMRESVHEIIDEGIDFLEKMKSE